MFNSDRLKKLTIENGLSQVAMAERLNINQSSYSKYETNKADLNLLLLMKLQEEFGVDPKEFIVTNNNSVHFETGSVVHGNGVVQSENYYAFPKEVVDSIVASNQNILQLISMVVKQNK